MVLCGHLDEADDLADDIELFAGRRPDVLPALELGGGLGHLSEEQVANRLSLIARYAKGVPKNALLVAPIQALMQSVPSRKQLEQLMLTLKAGDALEPEKLIVWLSEHGYNRLDQVEVPGDFAVRGGIIDVYLPGDFEVAGDQVGLTARIDFFGDQIESIKRFDLDTMGSLEVHRIRCASSISRASFPKRAIRSACSAICRRTRSSCCGRRWKSPSRRKSYLDRLAGAEGDLSAVGAASASRSNSRGWN